jgi:hypothetical protein
MLAGCGFARVSTAAAQSFDQPPPSLVEDACPDGSTGIPPICFALTGDTSPVLTHVVTPATLVANSQDSNAVVDGNAAIDPLNDTSGLPVQSQEAYH